MPPTIWSRSRSARSRATTTPNGGWRRSTTRHEIGSRTGTRRGSPPNRSKCDSRKSDGPTTWGNGSSPIVRAPSSTRAPRPRPACRRPLRRRAPRWAAHTAGPSGCHATRQASLALDRSERPDLLASALVLGLGPPSRKLRRTLSVGGSGSPFTTKDSPARGEPPSRQAVVGLPATQRLFRQLAPNAKSPCMSVQGAAELYGCCAGGVAVPAASISALARQPLVGREGQWNSKRSVAARPASSVASSAISAARLRLHQMAVDHPRRRHAAEARQFAAARGRQPGTDEVQSLAPYMLWF